MTLKIVVIGLLTIFALVQAQNDTIQDAAAEQVKEEVKEEIKETVEEVKQDISDAWDTANETFKNWTGDTEKYMEEKGITWTHVIIVLAILVVVLVAICLCCRKKDENSYVRMN